MQANVHAERVDPAQNKQEICSEWITASKDVGCLCRGVVIPMMGRMHEPE